VRAHRKRSATEDEDDDVAANANLDSPYAVFISSLHPTKTKGVLQDANMGEPVLVYTGTKPPAPGSQAATASKPAKKKTAKDATPMPPPTVR
jgi:hypothetical protein